MTDLYYPLIERVVKKAVGEHIDDPDSVRVLTQKILDRQVVVEKCEHGNYFRHMVGMSGNVRPEEVWCGGTAHVY